MSTPGGAKCMGGLAAGGAMAGGAAGGGVGLVGLAGAGVGVVVTEPAGLVVGTVGGGASGVALGMTVCPGGAAGGGGNGNIPGRPYTGKNAAKEAFKHLEKYHGTSPEVASERLHAIKEAAGLGAADDVAIGRTGDVYNAANGEWIGSLTTPR